MGQGYSLLYLQIYQWKIKLYLSLSWDATEVETAITANMMLQVTPPKLRDSEKSYGSWTRIPMLHENLNCNGLLVVMGKYLNSADLYSFICELQTWVLGFDSIMGLLDGNWLSAKSTCWNEWQYASNI
jgi:hypothetical protein